MQTSDHSKISVTAKLVAYFRQFTDIPYASDVAVFIDAEDAFTGIVSKNDLTSKDLLKYTPIFEVRYKSIATLIRKHHIEQVLELASGFSLRGLSMSQSDDLTYIESDLPGINQDKQKLIASIRERHNLIDRGNHSLATINALDSEELRKAAAKLQKGKKLAVVNEGLIHYFTPEERELITHNVRELLKEFGGGVWITPDFSTKRDAKSMPPEMIRFRNAIASATDRQLHMSAFEDEADREKFFADMQLTSECHFQFDLNDKLSCEERIEFHPEMLKRLRQFLRIWALSPAS